MISSTTLVRLKSERILQPLKAPTRALVLLTTLNGLQHQLALLLLSASYIFDIFDWRLSPLCFCNLYNALLRFLLLISFMLLL